MLSVNCLLSDEYRTFLEEYVKKHPPIPKKKNLRWAWAAACVDAANKLLFSSDRNDRGIRSKLLIDRPDNDTLYKRLEDSWELYRLICFHGGTCLILRQYSLMIGINYSTLRAYGSGDRRPASDLSALVQGFRDEVEADLLNRVVDNDDIGALFTLKAHYGYSDRPAQKLIIKTVAADTLPDPEEQQEKINRIYEEIMKNG